MTDLNDLLPPNSGVVLEEARLINDAGQIVASGYDASGFGGLFLLTPP